MVWFKVDDQWADHPKVQAAGRDGRALWMVAGVKCSGLSSDGLVDGRMIKLYAAMADVQWRKAAALLVEAGLWHDRASASSCSRCSVVATRVGMADGDYLFHDWSDWQLLKAGKDDPIARQHDRRNKELRRNKGLCRQVRERDRDVCRYCGSLTRWDGDRKSALSGTYDHVDPFGENTLENVVVACRRCNGIKRDRTPEQADMILLTAPRPTRPDLAEIQPDQAVITPDLPESLEAGPGQVGSDPGQVGSDRVGSGPGPGPGPGAGSDGGSA